MRRPRLSSSAPIEAAAKPLPKEETTPPVTKMKRHASGSRSGTEDYSKPAESGYSVNSGAVAQLGARFHGMEEVRGSNPLSSTIRARSARMVPCVAPQERSRAAQRQRQEARCAARAVTALAGYPPGALTALAG